MQESITPAPALLQQPPAALAAAALIAADDSDEKSPLSQLRAQLVSLILFCLTWLSAFCVIARPLRRALPYDDELISSLCYAFFASAAGLHAVLYHLLTRQDMCSACFGGSSSTTAPSLSKEEPNPLPLPSTQPQPLPQIQVQPPTTIDETDRCTTTRLRSLNPIPDDMNVTIMDPSMVVNSFYDPRQSKTARRFFQKQKLLQMQNNLQQQQQQQYHHHRRHHHRHSINNVPRSIRSSHSPIAEEALLNASSAKAKVSNVNIHVEMGAYDWHELQSRMSLDNNSCSWTKSGKQLMPPSSTMDRRGGRGYRVHSPSQSEIVLRVESTTPPPPPPPRYSTLSGEKQKRKRHGTHSRVPKKSKWEPSSYQLTHPDEKHVYVFVENNDGAASPTKKETSV